MKIKREHLTIIVVLLIGAVARIIKFDDPNLVEDTATYARLGKNLIESGRYAFGENYNTGVFYPPGYPVFIGLIDLIFRDLFFSAKLVSFISSCVSIFLSYLIGKKLYNKEAGLFAALLFAVYPVIIIVSVQGYADALYICFLLLSILLFLISLKRNNAIDHILLGILFSVTYLIRPEGIFLLTLPFLQVFGVFSEKIEFNKRYLLRTVTLSLIFALIISPYMLFIINYTGKFSLSGKGTISILLGELSGDRKYHEVVNTPENPFDKLAYSLNNDKSQLKGWDKNATLSLKDYVLKDPVAFARKYQKNLIQEISILIKLLIPVLLPHRRSLLSYIS
ncbi:MAG: glycosyltransferase family 39 protein [Nitrospirae bacterium]|nr:glycosyltransferase family 39 protein [Nitrospirota bacterium]